MQVHRIDALTPGSELHAYIIDRALGSGAFGITYLANQKFLGSRHVIKEYLPDCALREHDRSTVSPRSEQDRDLFAWGYKCFMDEARLLYGLRHPHIVKVTDLFEANGTAYFVMPYLEGITLAAWMKQHPKPTQDELETIFVPLLEGLKYIHDKGLLHRDVKPENIYLTANTHPILIDFGAARIAIGQKSKALTQVLTPHFAPFEQYASKGTFTPALDLYSLAACMYQAITGKLPEEAPNRIVEDLQSRLASGQYAQNYASHFLQAIDKSLSVYAKDRHQDGFELQKDLVGQTDEIRRQEEFVFAKDLGVEKEREVSQAPMVSSTDTAQEEPGTIWTEPFTGMEFIYVGLGEFMMGSDDSDALHNEKPVHKVCITKGFYLGKYPVTQAQWEKVMGSNPSHFKVSSHPVESVSRVETLKFISKLNRISSTKGFRLPTEAEWEYAAKGGNMSQTYTYAGSDEINDVAWYYKNSGGSTHPVGVKLPNTLCIYDMSGNVWEWVSDRFDSNCYTQSPRNNPQGPVNGPSRVFRGGSWNNYARNCRTTNRNHCTPGSKFNFLGFRLVLSPLPITPIV